MAKKAAQSGTAPSVNLKTRFHEMKRLRDEFIVYADQSAAVTMPSLRPSGKNYEASAQTGIGATGTGTAENGRVPQQLHTQSPHGARALRSLSSVLGKLLMPRGVKYGDFDFPRSVWQKIRAADAMRRDEVERRKKNPPVSIEEALREQLIKRSTNIINGLDAKNARPRVRSLIRRQLVEGQCMLVNRRHDIQIFPLRSFVLRRETGKVAEAVLCEKVGGSEYGTEEDERYTRILYPNEMYPDRQGVWHQMGSNQRMGRPSADMKHHQYIVSTGDWPDIDDYVTGYVYENLRQIHRIEHCEASLGEAMGVAAWNVPGMRVGSIPAQNPRVVKERNPGDPLICNEGDIFWINSGVKITDWAFVGEILKMYREDLDRAFAMRLIDRESTAEATATAVIQMIEELNELTEGLFGALEESLLRPLIWSEFWLHEEEDPLFAGLIEDETIAEVLPNLLELQVLTGVNAIQRQRALFDMMTVLDRAKQLDETLLVDGVEVADRGADSLMIEKEGLYGRAPAASAAPTEATPQGTDQPAAAA